MKLALFLLREECTEFSAALKDSFANYEPVETTPVDGIELELYVQCSQEKSPRWLSDLSSISNQDLSETLNNRFSSALVMLTRHGRQFLLTYGQAHHLVDRGKIEVGFGLKVTANALAEDGLLSSDTRGLADAKTQRTVVPTRGRIYQLGIEPSESLVRSLTGEAKVENFASRLSGADSLKLSIPNFSLRQIASKLDSIMGYYASDEYLRAFPFLDYFARVDKNQKELLDTLWSSVVSSINQGSTDVEFAAPEPLEPFDISHFVVSFGREEVEVAGLDRGSMYEALRLLGCEKHEVRKVHVEARDSSDFLLGDAYLLDSYVVFESTNSGERFALCSGQWFRVSSSYVEEIDTRIRGIEEVDLRLPEWSDGEQDEAAYNAAASKELGWVLLDRRNFPIGGPNQKVEICDFLSPQRELVCVKKMDGSPTLSHLFAQGAVSATLLMADDSYQEAVLTHLSEVSEDKEFDNSTRWTVVYAIATDKPGPLADSIYFFSKVNLDRSIRVLRSTGIKVALAKIDLTRKPVAESRKRKRGKKRESP